MLLRRWRDVGFVSEAHAEDCAVRLSQGRADCDCVGPLTDEDRERELQIDLARMVLMSARSREVRRTAWERIRALVAARSPAMVRHMERRKGLR